MKQNVNSLGSGVCRWSGRTLGTLLVALTLMIAIGEGMPNPFTQPITVQVGFLALGLVLSGILAGWKWELAGGLVSLAGWGLFVVAVIGSIHRLNWFILALA